MLSDFPIISSILTRRLSFSFPSFLTDNPIYRNDNARVILFTLGIGYTLFKALSYTKSILSPLFQFRKDLSSWYGKKTWAVITGTTEGIGRAFAFELASRGFNIVMVARNEEKLKKVDQELRLKYPSIQTRIVLSDFTLCYEPGFAEKIYEQVNDLDISILINNAGVYQADYYYRIAIKDIRDLILTNALSHTLITRVFLPRLAARTNRSAIINITSIAAASPKPFEQIYSATKVFHDYLSRGLVFEHPNIDIMSMRPGEVSTNMNNYAKPNYNTISAEDLVKTTLSLVGSTSYSYGHWKHKLDFWFAEEVVPSFLRFTYFKKRFNIKD